MTYIFFFFYCDGANTFSRNCTQNCNFWILIFSLGLVICGQRRKWQPTPVLLPGKSHGRRSLVGCSPWGLKELDTTERLHFHFSLSCIGEGNGNTLQCFCLENPREGEPGGLPSIGSHRVGHDWSDLAAAAAVIGGTVHSFVMLGRTVRLSSQSAS